MREQEVQKTEATETANETVEHSEPKPREEKKRASDTLTDDNPLICRGID
jgi:hypothetical protein